MTRARKMTQLVYPASSFLRPDWEGMMLIRHLLFLTLSLALSLAAIFLSPDGPSFADEPKPVVSLLLVKANAERQDKDTFFRCDTVLDNATRKALSVHSHFSSVFDGLELVVTTKEGKPLAQQPYTFHQSPQAPLARVCILKQGKRAGRLMFPIRDLPADTKVVKVRLVGTLPGSEYQRILSTETVEVTIKDR